MPGWVFSEEKEGIMENRRSHQFHTALSMTLWILFIVFCVLELVYIPLFGVDGTGVPVPRWQMRPPDLICHLVHSISPALVEPVQILLFWGIGFGAYFGFRTISRKTVLDNTARLRVFATIQEYPGIHFNALREQTGMNRGTLRYHLSILSLTGKINGFQDGVFSRYVPSEMGMSEYDQIVASRFQNRPDRKFITYLIEHPDASQRDIAEALGVAPSVVSKRIRQLYDEGVVAMERLGRSTRVALADEAVEVVRRIQGTGIRPDQVPVPAPEIPG